MHEVQCKLGGSAKYHDYKVVVCKVDLWQHTFVNMQPSVPSKSVNAGPRRWLNAKMFVALAWEQSPWESQRMQGPGTYL